ncbi:MAG: hypothetical protein LBS40_07135 [Burkholderiales bacterium]|jgi:hypothetical protein|nr:hypothetical protein [Burkholderiales bacterium]
MLLTQAFRALFVSILGVLTLFFVSSVESAEIERLSLFIYDGQTTYEDRRIAPDHNDFPTGVTARFQTTASPQQEPVWEWEIRNESGAALKTTCASPYSLTST